MKFSQFLRVLQKIVIFDNTYNIVCRKMLCQVGRENAKKERRAEARLPFPPSHNKGGGMRKILVLDAADCCRL